MCSSTRFRFELWRYEGRVDLVALVIDLDLLYILGGHVSIAPSPYSVFVLMRVVVDCPLVSRAIARSGCTFLYYAGRHGLQVICPTDLSEHIDEGGSKVGVIVAQLGGLVIPWEDMMVIMPALAEGADTDAVAIGGTDGAGKVRERKIGR